jgi:ribosome modulation factor
MTSNRKVTGPYRAKIRGRRDYQRGRSRSEAPFREPHIAAAWEEGWQEAYFRANRKRGKARA